MPAVFARSSDAIPISSVAQRMNPWSLARSFWYWPRTWSSVPNRPCPYRDGRTVTGSDPSTATRGMMQSNFAV